MLFVDIRKYVAHGSANDRGEDIGHVHCPRGTTLSAFRAAAIFLFISSLLTFGKEIIREPIKCTSLKHRHPMNEAFEQYCWTEGTRGIVWPHEAIPKNDRTVESHAGIRPLAVTEMECKFNEAEDRKVPCKSWRTHNYYVWVPFVLFLQAVACYLPVYLWKRWDSADKVDSYIRKCKPKEGTGSERRGRIGDGGSGSDEENPLAVAGRKCAVDLAKLARVLLRHRGAHGVYGSKFVLSHAIGLALLVAQLHLVNVFLEGRFVDYGKTLLGLADFPIMGTNLTSATPRDAMERVFPTVNDCKMVAFGVNARKEVKHGICVISVNLLNQQIYWAVFAVYVALTAWTALSIVGHVLLKFFPELRSALIWTQMPRGIRFRQVAELMNPMCFSDWFILRRTLAHFDSHDREKLLNCVLRAINRQTSPDLREAEAADLSFRKMIPGCAADLAHRRIPM